MIHVNQVLAQKNLFWLKQITLLVKLIFLPLPASPEDLWLQIKATFSNQDLERNWRGYEYIKLFPVPFVEIVLICFPPGSYTGIHDHDFRFNINKVIVGEIEDNLYRIRNSKPRLVGQPRTFSKNQLSFVYPFQSHEMKNLESSETSAITLNLHFPARKD